MESDLKENKFSVAIGKASYAWKDFSKIFERKENLSFGDQIGFLFQGLFSSELLFLYEKKKQEWINSFSDAF